LCVFTQYLVGVAIFDPGVEPLRPALALRPEDRLAREVYRGPT
jgi:hypothetical protein